MNFMIWRLIDVENFDLKIQMKFKIIVVLIMKKQTNMLKIKKNHI